MSEGYSSSDSDSDSGCCSSRSDASAELKLYRAFIFSVPIFFTLILLFLFYVFYLRPRRVDWSSLGMRPFGVTHDNNNAISSSGLGLNKELREMLPIIVYKESFSVKDTICSVCLLDYQPEDRLQQIPACGHTFHMSCIDLWLANHSTCPLCRLSLLTMVKSSTETSNMQRPQSNDETQRPQNNEETQRPQSNVETQAMEFSDARSARHIESTALQNVSGEVAISAHCIDVQGQNVQNNQRSMNI